MYRHTVFLYNFTLKELTELNGANGANGVKPLSDIEASAPMSLMTPLTEDKTRGFLVSYIAQMRHFGAFFV